MICCLAVHFMCFWHALSLWWKQFIPSLAEPLRESCCALWSADLLFFTRFPPFPISCEVVLIQCSIHLGFGHVCRWWYKHTKLLVKASQVRNFQGQFIDLQVRRHKNPQQTLWGKLYFCCVRQKHTCFIFTQVWWRQISWWWHQNDTKEKDPKESRKKCPAQNHVPKRETTLTCMHGTNALKDKATNKMFQLPQLCCTIGPVPRRCE